MTSNVDPVLVEMALEEIRPVLRADGGDLVFHGVDSDGIVSVELLGACGTCPLSVVTLLAGVEVIVLQRVPGVAGVVAHSPILPNVMDTGSLDSTSTAPRSGA